MKQMKGDMEWGSEKADWGHLIRELEGATERAKWMKQVDKRAKEKTSAKALQWLGEEPACVLATKGPFRKDWKSPIFKRKTDQQVYFVAVGSSGREQEKDWDGVRALRSWGVTGNTVPWNQGSSQSWRRSPHRAKQQSLTLIYLALPSHQCHSCPSDHWTLVLGR